MKQLETVIKYCSPVNLRRLTALNELEELLASDLQNHTGEKQNKYNKSP